jgi:hypothetical protein
MTDEAEARNSDAAQSATNFYGTTVTDRNSDAADVERLKRALSEAADLIEEWGAYASPYFQEKWGLADDVARIRALAATAEGSEPPKAPTFNPFELDGEQ